MASYEYQLSPHLQNGDFENKWPWDSQTGILKKRQILAPTHTRLQSSLARDGPGPRVPSRVQPGVAAGDPASLSRMHPRESRAGHPEDQAGKKTHELAGLKPTLHLSEPWLPPPQGDVVIMQPAGSVREQDETMGAKEL